MFFCVYGLLNAALYFRLKDFLNIMLFWNVLLAFVPYVLVNFAIKVKFKLFKYFILITALLFWPNAMYLVTDFIHLSYELFFETSKTYFKEILPWIKLMNITLGFIFGYLMSLESIRLVLNHFKLKKVRRTVVTISLFLIGSIGIFIGRFIRLNSWDLINPVSVMQKWVTNMDTFAVLFIVSLTLFSYFSFWLYENWNH